MKHPEGLKYTLHLGTVGGETLVRYDNAHESHHVHRGGEVEEIEFEGMTELVERFLTHVQKHVE